MSEAPAELEPASRDDIASMATFPPTWTLTPEQARLGGMRRIPIIGPGPKMPRCEDVTLAGGSPEDLGCTVRVLAPSERTAGCVIYLHGGGWVLGSIDQFDMLARCLAVDTDATVVLVGYRKAPEHPFPAAVEDAIGAARWATAHLQDLTGDAAAPLVLAGDSAGGNLATVACQQLKDDASVTVAEQVLAYPVTASDTDSPSYRDPRCQQLLTARLMEWFWDQYAPREVRRDPRAAPLRAPSLSGLPPAFVALARYDPLYSEGLAYSEALERAGVPTQVRVFHDQMHGFLNMNNILPGAEAGRRWLAMAVRSIVGTRRARSVANV